MCVSDQPYSVAAAGIALGLNGRSHAPVSFFAERCSVLAEFSGLFSEHARREPEFPNVDTLHKLLRSEELTSELQSLMRISYAVFCLKKKNKYQITQKYTNQ